MGKSCEVCEAFGYKDIVESRLQDSTLNWFNQDGIKGTGLSVRIDDLDFNNPSNYDELAHKIIDTVIEFKELFVPIVNSFKG